VKWGLHVEIKTFKLGKKKSKYAPNPPICSTHIFKHEIYAHFKDHASLNCHTLTMARLNAVARCKLVVIHGYVETELAYKQLSYLMSIVGAGPYDLPLVVLTQCKIFLTTFAACLKVMSVDVNEDQPTLVH
jgi:hypothetical protein